MTAQLGWQIVTMVLGLLTLALLWDFLQSWLRGIRSEREVLAAGLIDLRTQIASVRELAITGAEGIPAFAAQFEEFEDKLKKLDARVLDERELRARR